MTDGRICCSHTCCDRGENENKISIYSSNLKKQSISDRILTQSVIASFYRADITYVDAFVADKAGAIFLAQVHATIYQFLALPRR